MYLYLKIIDLIRDIDISRYIQTGGQRQAEISQTETNRLILTGRILKNSNTLKQSKMTITKEFSYGRIYK